MVRHILAHRAGVPVLDRPLTPVEAADPDVAAAVLAEQEPAWEPGTDHGYHAQTWAGRVSPGRRGVCRRRGGGQGGCGQG